MGDDGKLSNDQRNSTNSELLQGLNLELSDPVLAYFSNYTRQSVLRYKYRAEN